MILTYVVLIVLAFIVYQTVIKNKNLCESSFRHRLIYNEFDVRPNILYGHYYTHMYT